MTRKLVPATFFFFWCICLFFSCKAFADNPWKNIRHDPLADPVCLATSESSDWLARNDGESVPARKAGEVWNEPVTGMVFLWIPGGCYRMGCGSWARRCNDDEKPVHEVCLKGFWMGKYEVMQAEWQQVMGSSPSLFKKGDNYPVENISYNDTVLFIRKLMAENQEQYTFRLPTEAQWEYACRSGGKPQKYCGGKKLGRLGWYSGNSRGATHPVGTKKPNGLGLYDMSGNVWEWCMDIYESEVYSEHERNDPLYRGAGFALVNRGGSWFNKAKYCRSTTRDSDMPVYRNDGLGFRLVRIP